MLYKSTRNDAIKVSSSEAIINGIAPDGGLYVPVEFPQLNLSELLGLSYQELASAILKMYLTDFTDQEIKCSVYKAYDEKFVDEAVVPIKYLDGYSVLELYHGKTLAFKDMALSILPYLMKKAAKRLEIKEEIVILAATSGDTGKAALEGFSDIEGTKIVVFYPSVGISDIQRQQMVTQEGDNTYVFGIEGNFDDAQSAVKEVFADQKLKKEMMKNGYRFSSANSINIGRLIPQIVYYVYGYLEHVKNNQIQLGDEMNVVVPTGNFGNILAARYAKAMGLPFKTLICASNENHVLTDFIHTGVYNLDRDFKITNSPSMDILISSNLERYLSLVGEDVNNHMEKLKSDKKYKLSNEGRQALKEFFGGYADEAETLSEISEVFKKDHYLIDTHTAVAVAVYKKYKMLTDDQTKTLLVSTASPYKFTRDVLKSITVEKLLDDDFELIEVLEAKSGVKVPEVIKGLADREVKHPHIISKTSIKNTINTILR